MCFKGETGWRGLQHKQTHGQCRCLCLRVSVSVSVHRFTDQAGAVQDKTQENDKMTLKKQLNKQKKDYSAPITAELFSQFSPTVVVPKLFRSWRSTTLLAECYQIFPPKKTSVHSQPTTLTATFEHRRLAHTHFLSRALMNLPPAWNV